MASTIQLKTGTGSAVPSSLTQGEVAINIDNGLFYFGSGSSEAVKILESFTHITASGNISASGDIITTKLRDSVGNNHIVFGNNNNTIAISSDDVEIMRLDGDSQRVGINKTTPGEALEVVGNISASGNVYATDYFDNNANINTIYSPIAGGTGIVTVGAVNAGSITSGFTSIDVGAGAITTTGTLTGGALVATGNTTLGNAATDTHTFIGHITASGDISASGYIYGKLRRTVESKTSDYTLVASDAGKVILMDVGGVDITISASVFTAGDEFTIINNSGSPTACLVKTGPLTTMFVVGTAYLNADFTLAARRGIKFICEVGGASPRFYGWRS